MKAKELQEMKTNIKIFLHRWLWLGWKFPFSYFIKAYWTQDIQFINEGYDIISFRKPVNYYFYGTFPELEREFN